MFNERFRGMSSASFEVRQVSLAQKMAERASPKVDKRFFRRTSKRSSSRKRSAENEILKAMKDSERILCLIKDLEECLPHPLRCAKSR